MKQKEKKYLNVAQKAAYGAVGFGNNFFYTFVSTYMLVYLTDIMGMNAAIIGVLILISKLFDGVTDVLCGNLIDKTNTKYGKARPWLIGSAVPLGVVQILLFTVPETSAFAQYAYFLVFYSAANAIFYTANSCATNTMSALITYNPTERVQLGSIFYLMGSFAGMVIPVACTWLVSNFGGGTTGWRITASIFALVQVVFCIIAFVGTKELPPEGGATEKNVREEERISFWKILRIVVTNKYYLIMLGIQLMIACIGTSFFTSGAYYCQWILGNGALLSAFSSAFSMGMLAGMIINPFFVARFGYRKTMGWTNVASIVFLVLFAVGAFIKNMPLMIVCMFLKNMTGFASIGCCMNAAIADIAKYGYRVHGIHMEGTMFSCSSMGQKVGQGVMASVCGWLLTIGGYIGTATTQSDGALRMIVIMFAILPLVLTSILTVLCFCLDIEDVNKKWEEEHIK